MTALVAGLGLLLVHELGERALVRRRRRPLVRRGTAPTPGTTSRGSAASSPTPTSRSPPPCILCGLFLWRWRRWTEAALLAGALVLEASIFMLSSFVVDRPRPPIAHLDPIPPTGAFPSGHSAAAVAFYGAIAIIVVLAHPQSPRPHDRGRRRVRRPAGGGRVAHVPRHAPPERRRGRSRDRDRRALGHVVGRPRRAGVAIPARDATTRRRARPVQARLRSGPSSRSRAARPRTHRSRPCTSRRCQARKRSPSWR